MPETEAPEAPSEAPVTPAPADAPKPEDSTPEEGKPPRTLEQVEAELAKTRREAAGYRTKLREVEPLAKKAQEAEEAKKDAVQKATERAEAAEKREAEKDLALYRRDLADEHHIPRDKMHLLGSGSREEMEAIAAEIGPLFATSEKTPAPPSDRPVEGLRPGASPEPPKPADDSYPASWTPNHVRDKQRSQYGQ